MTWGAAELREWAATLHQWAFRAETAAQGFRQQARRCAELADEIEATPHPDDEVPTAPSDFGGLWLWRENGAIRDIEGLSRCRQIAIAGQGPHIRIIAPNGERPQPPSVYMDRTRAAKNAGALAVCIDLETNPFAAAGRDFVERICTQVREVLPLALAPKAYLDHLARMWNLPFAAACRWCANYSDLLIPWIYNLHGDGWANLVAQMRADGYPHPVICLGELYRTWDGARPWNRRDIELILNAGHGCAGFLPDKSISASWSLVSQSPAYKAFAALA